MFGDDWTIRDEIELYFSGCEEEVGYRRAIHITATKFNVTPDAVEKIIEDDD